MSTDERAMIAEWVARHEAKGHVFYYDRLLGAIHLVPSLWLDFGQAEYFKSKFSQALADYLYERECESMCAYLAGQEPFELKQLSLFE